MATPARQAELMCRAAHSHHALWTIPTMVSALANSTSWASSEAPTETIVAFCLRAYPELFEPVERPHHYRMHCTLPEALEKLGVPLSPTVWERLLVGF